MKTVNEMSKTYQYRKVMKPLLERKRRARINKCLDDLKDLMIDSMQHKSDNLNKIEKADILELTVQHLRNIRNSSKPLSHVDSYRTGFVNAANEISRVMAFLPQINKSLGTKVMTHLGLKLNELDAVPRSKAELNVQCEQSYYPALLSPTSSGYGSDSESSMISSTDKKSNTAESISVWRPW